MTEAHSKSIRCAPIRRAVRRAIEMERGLISIAVIRAEGNNSDKENASSPVEQPNESSLGWVVSASASLTALNSGRCRFRPVVA